MVNQHLFKSLCLLYYVSVQICMSAQTPTDNHHFVPSRRLAGSSGSSSKPTKVMKTVETPYPTCSKVTIPDHCKAVFDAAEWRKTLTSGGFDTNEETNFDSDTFGHARYDCIQPLLEAGQYDKAISYAWCVEPHCTEKCPGADCPTATVEITEAQQCRSAVFNFLGFAKRKHQTPELVKAEEYYTQALTLWPGNCGAKAYRSELELQKGRKNSGTEMLKNACETCTVESECALKQAVDVFHSDGVDVGSSCLWVRKVEANVSTKTVGSVHITGILTAMLLMLLWVW